MWVRTCKSWLELSILVGAVLQASCGGILDNAATPSSAASVNDAEGWIVLQDRTWVPVRDPFTTELERARSAYESGDQRTASRSFRKAADILRRDPSPLSPYNRERLEEASHDLDRLGSMVERGEIRRRGATDPILAHVCEIDATNRWPSAPIEVWLPLAGRPEEHFQECQTYLGEGNLPAAAAEIQKAFGFMRLDAGRSTFEGRMLINESIHSLGAFVKRLESSEKIDPASLDWVFANTEEALAHAHQLNAIEAWASRRADLTGAELESAAINLEDANLRLGRDDQSDTFAQTRLTARELMIGGVYDISQVNNTIAAIESEIQSANTPSNPTTTVNQR